jgi:hypothetical protein
MGSGAFVSRTRIVTMLAQELAGYTGFPEAVK